MGEKLCSSSCFQSPRVSCSLSWRSCFLLCIATVQRGAAFRFVKHIEDENGQKKVSHTDIGHYFSDS